MPKITSIEGFRKALASERAELLTHILSAYFGWSPIWSYHSNCRFDVRDVLLCLYEAEDVDQYIAQSIKLFERRIDRYKARRQKAQATLSQYLYTYKTPPTKESRRKEGHTNQSVYRTLEWLDIIYECEQVAQGYYLQRYETDCFLLGLLKRWQSEGLDDLFCLDFNFE